MSERPQELDRLTFQTSLLAKKNILKLKYAQRICFQMLAGAHIKSNFLELIYCDIYIANQ